MPYEPRLLDAVSEAHLDAVCRTAAALFRAPIALVTAFETGETRLGGSCGPHMDADDVRRAFGDRLAQDDGGDVLVVPDLARDDRFAACGLVSGRPRLRFFAGIRLSVEGRGRGGLLCVMDTASRRDFGEDETRQLRDLALSAEAHLRLHVLQDDRQRASQGRTAELAVQESEAQYRLLADAASDMIVRRTIGNVRTYVSPASRELLGFTPEELLKVPLSETLHPDDRQRTIDFLSALQAGRIDHDRITHRLRHRDGRWIWVEARTRLVRDRDGTPVEVITAARDVSERMLADEALKASESRYRALADALPQLVWIMSVEDGAASYVNQGFEDYCGPVQSQRSARLALVHPDETGRIAVLWKDVLESESACGAEARLRRRDGVYRWHKVVCLPIREAGAIVGILGTALDIDEIVAARAALQHTTDLLRLAQEAAGAGLWEWEVRTGAIRHSPESARMFHFPEAAIAASGAVVAITQEEWASRVHPDELPRIWEAVRSAIERRATYRCEFRLAAVDGVERWIQAVAHVAYDEATGEALRFVGLHFDVTERKAAEDRVAHLAHHDELTGLPNRRLLHETLDREIAATRTGQGYTAILLCDLDRFKAVNDTFGHNAGDRLLRTLARRLRSVLREGDMVARLGGDEFAVVLARRSDPGDAGAVAERVIEAVGRPFDLGASEASVGVSIGVALGHRGGTGADDLFRHADIALYRAKAAGRNTFRTYEPGMDAAAVARNQLEIDMRQAVQGGGFSLHYQPIVSVSTDDTSGFEALMRWPHPTRGWISPVEFIPLAEETGAIVALGTWALREACGAAAAWPDDLRVAVNISAVQFARPGLELSVAAALSASGLPPRRLELEITESVLMSDAEAVIACLHRLRALGVRIALDDFGTGYSSLSYLRRFPFDKIKIDRSFVADIDDPDTAAIVRAVVGLGERLGAGITAEGVETQDQFERVRREGCTEAQGYLFSKPLPSEEVLTFDRIRRGRAA